MKNLFTPMELENLSWCEGYCLTSNGKPLIVWNGIERTIIRSPHENLNEPFLLDLPDPVSQITSSGDILTFLSEKNDGFHVTCYDLRNKSIHFPECEISKNRYTPIMYEDKIIDLKTSIDGSKELRLVHYNNEELPITLLKLNAKQNMINTQIDVSSRGEIAIVLQQEDSPISDVYVFNIHSKTLTLIYKGDRTEFPVSVGWDHDGNRLVCLTRRGANYGGVIVFVDTKSITRIVSPTLLEKPLWCPMDNEILLVIDNWPFSSLAIYDIENESLKKVLIQNNLFITRPTWYKDTLYFCGISPNTPPSLYRWSTISKETHIQTRKPNYNKELHIDSVDIESEEGHIIPCILYKAKSERGKTIIMLHGGPAGAWWAKWHPAIEKWTNEGFNILCVNPRGSTVRRKTLPQLRNGEFGVLDAKDVKTSVEFLIKEGIAEKGKVVLFGESYGGYLAYQSMLKLKNHIASMVILYSYIHPSSLLQSKDSTVQRFAKYAFINENLIEPLKLNSNCPILQIHGSHDLQLPVNSMKDYHHKLIGLNHRFLELEDGHGFRKKENIIMWLDEATQFIKEHI
ncbi:alpha/beta hydrolase family protein [Cytobacillus sp. Hm23]